MSTPRAPGCTVDERGTIASELRQSLRTVHVVQGPPLAGNEGERAEREAMGRRIQLTSVYEYVFV